LAQDQGAATEAGARSDGQIEMDVVHALDASQALKDDLITAATIQSEVTLTGTVSSESSRELAESISARVPGVTKVNNSLTVGNPQAAANAAESGARQEDDGQPEESAEAAPAQRSGQYPASGSESYPVPDQSQGQYARPQYEPAQPPVQAYEAPRGPVTIPHGTLLQLRTSEPVGSKSAKPGAPIQFIVIQDVAIGGVLAIPRGATVLGVVIDAKNTKSGDLGGNAELALGLTSLELGGQSYPLVADLFRVKGPSKAGRTVNSAVSGGILGTIIGCAAGRGVGCAIGAGAGVAAGTAASAASSGPGAWIPAEARVDFHLKEPLTVTPVNAQEAARLAQGLYPGGPTLYQRGNAPNGYPYGSPYYAYPPVYYRPYSIEGGYYYWR